jgi:hypothetical protein
MKRFKTLSLTVMIALMAMMATPTAMADPVGGGYLTGNEVQKFCLTLKKAGVLAFFGATMGDCTSAAVEVRNDFRQYLQSF